MRKARFYWKELIATFWFVPTLTILAAIMLSIGMVYLDGHVSFTHTDLGRFFLVNSAASARSVLTTISSAMMGVAGTVFSVTLVALTLASSQFGPRLIKNFMYVRLNQVVLGSYVSTYLYCLFVLNAIRESDGYTFIPSLSILLAILATMVNIVLLIIFIHQIAVSIQANNVVTDIAIFIFNQVRTLFPEQIGDEADEESMVDSTEATAAYAESWSLKSPRSGYLQYIDGNSIIKHMAKHDALLKLHWRSGAHVVDGMEIGVLHSHVPLETKDADAVLGRFVIGRNRVAQQDVEFSIHQMVEIAVRALSPGVNDPFTAIACIDNLTSTMCYLAQVKFPSRFRYDDKDSLRLIANAFDFDDVLEAAFNQIRQFAGGSPAVIIRLMEALLTIDSFVKRDGQRDAVVKQAEMVLSTGRETIQERNDLAELIKKAKRICPSVLESEDKKSIST